MEFLATAASKADDPQLAKLVARGVAIHNSGMSPHDRGLVERTFLSGRCGTVMVSASFPLH